MAGRLEPGVVTVVVEVEPCPTGDEVPTTEAPEAGSPARMSPWVEGTPPPRSMKRDRSFFSRACISSGFPWDSADASHLRRILMKVLQFYFINSLKSLTNLEYMSIM